MVYISAALKSRDKSTLGREIAAPLACTRMPAANATEEENMVNMVIESQRYSRRFCTVLRKMY